MALTFENSRQTTMLETCSLFDDSQGTCLCELFALSQMQQRQQAHYLRTLKIFWQSSVASVRAGCQEVLVDFERKFRADGPKESAYAGVAGGKKGSESSSQPGDDGMFKYTMVAGRRVVHRQLFHFLLLCDYMVLHAIKVSVMDSTASLCRRFHRGPAADFSPIVLAELGLEFVSHDAGPPQLVLSPTELELGTEIKGIAHSFIKTVCSGSRLLTHPDLVEFYALFDEYHPISEMDQMLAKLIEDSVEHKQMLQDLGVGILRAYDKTEDLLRKYEHFAEVVAQNGDLDFEQIELTAETESAPFEDLLKLEAQFKVQLEEMEAIEDFVDCDALRVVCRSYKSQLIPSPRRCIEKIRELLPRLLARMQRRLLDQVVNSNSLISRVPHFIGEYMKYCVTLDQVDKEQDDLEYKIRDSMKRLQLLQEHGMDLSQPDHVTCTILQSQVKQLQASLLTATENREKNNGKFVGVLEDMLVDFSDDVSEMQLLSEDPSLIRETDEPQSVLATVKDLSEQIKVLEEKAVLIQSYQRALRRAQGLFIELYDMAQAVNLRRGVWETIEEVDEIYVRANSILLESLDKRVEEDRIQKWTRIALRADKELPPNNTVVAQLKQKVQGYRSLIATCNHIKNPAMKERHWLAIDAATGEKFARHIINAKREVQGLTLGLVLRLNFLAYTDEITPMSQKATQEQMLEDLLASIKETWKELEFPIREYKGQKDCSILGDCDEIEAQLDESMTTISSILANRSSSLALTCTVTERRPTKPLTGSDAGTMRLRTQTHTLTTIMWNRFVAEIQEEVETWNSKLKLVQATMDEWLSVQRNWMYLEPIFAAPDIQRQLPFEYKTFEGVDKDFRIIMRRAAENPTCVGKGTICKSGQRESFVHLHEALDRIQKALEDYLEFKRMAFPRFYFLSNDELLEILSQTRNVQAVQPFMNSCFDGIKSLDFGGQHPNSEVKVLDPNSYEIYGMVSPEGEYVSLGKNLKARGEVQDWLAGIEKRMVESLRLHAKDAMHDYATRSRKEWVMLHPAQLVIMVSQMNWCKSVEDALQGVRCARGFPPFTPEVRATGVSQCLELQLSHLRDQCQLAASKISALQRMSLVALITIDVHNRDILEDLVREKVHSTDDFLWQMRLRYYWNADLGAVGDCQIRQVTGAFVYGHEYLGASTRLVITELTDRCYLTLSGALDLKLGGAPQGPAGTGKTETTKDLAKALGRQCVVFNCGENLDAQFMSKFFKGLAQCGGWACFDEFNRINIEVLSVVAQQIISIQIGLRQNLSEIEFLGRPIRLLPSFGVFITMNPGPAYAGRTELPDNLKALFRPVAMMVPDYALVSEVMLFAEGFVEAKALSRKMVNLFKLSSEQLSQAKHYDFGMRAVKSVLVMAGARKRARPQLSEAVVLIRAMCDSNVPKFFDHDLSLFHDIVGDLFPGLELEAYCPEELRAALEDVLVDGGLQAPRLFVEKAIQLSDTLKIRFGVLLLGMTGSGKSTLIYALAAAMTALAGKKSSDVWKKVSVYSLNPKVVSLGELYGNYSLTTGEWKDGLASSIVRMTNGDKSVDQKWICFDGPVDAVWIESMNTVLDDNRMLCLPNGERIKLNEDTLRMLFEVDNVEMASPATISRLGIVNLATSALGCMGPLLTRFEGLMPGCTPDDVKSEVKGLFLSTLPAALGFVRAELREEIASVNSNLCLSCCNVFEALVNAFFESEECIVTFDSNASNLASECNFKEGVREDEKLQLLQCIFIFSVVWSVGANLDAESRVKFSEWFRTNIHFRKFPPNDTVYDYLLNPKESGFHPFSAVATPFEYDDEANFGDIVVPTVDTTRYQYLLERLCSVQRRTLLVGPSGTGKSVIVHNCIRAMSKKDQTVSCVINFSAQSSSARTEQMLELNLEKKRKGLYGPPNGKILVCFVDDVNMPRRDQFGSQPPVELLRQVIDTVRHFRPGGWANPAYAGGGGFYDRKLQTWNNIQSLVLLCACAPPGGGRNPVTPRFTRHFNMLYIPPPARAILKVIFASILGGHLKTFEPSIQALSNAAVDASVQVYEHLIAELLPTPAKSHYTYNLRDLAKVFQGMLTVTPNHCHDQLTFINLWIHESQRVFQDRLINTEDKDFFDSLLQEMLKRVFGVSVSHDTFSSRRPIFCHFGNQSYAAHEAPYAQVPDTSCLPRLLGSYLDSYNMATSNVMNLVFFQDAIEHVSRICRILRTPSGNAMLVGLGGSGKQSLSRLSAFIVGLKCQEVAAAKGYSMTEFREDLKKLYLSAGVDNKPCAFLFTDSQITDESFLEDFSCVLNTGEVPNLFSLEEQEQVVTDIKNVIPESQLPGSSDAIFWMFLKKARGNLHLILCMSPVGDSFRTRCRNFPSLINCCTIDWYLSWPSEALLDVALRTVSGELLDPQAQGDAAGIQDRPRSPEEGMDTQSSIAEVFVAVHTMVGALTHEYFAETKRRIYVTPKSFLDLLHLFRYLLKREKDSIADRRDKFASGLTKMSEVAFVIQESKRELDLLRPVLEEKAVKTEGLVKKVSKDTEVATKVKLQVEKETKEVEKQASMVRHIQADAQKDLDEALPAMERAVAALNSLTKGDITEVKSFNKPPTLVRTVMEAVCMLLGQSTNWDTAKKVLGQHNFMEQLINFNKDNIDERTHSILKKYTLDPQFEPEIVGNVSKAARGLCMWCRAIDVYAGVAKDVEPKRERLRQADQELKEAQDRLALKQQELQQVQNNVSKLEGQLAQARAGTYSQKSVCCDFVE
jgi:dynein heavy chain, axonemal